MHTVPSRDRDYWEPDPFSFLISYRPPEERRTNHDPRPTAAESGTTNANKSSRPNRQRSTSEANTKYQIVQSAFIEIRRPKLGSCGLKSVQAVGPSSPRQMFRNSADHHKGFLTNVTRACGPLTRV